MPAVGGAEWSGWSLAANEFWSTTDRNQGPETGIRSRNIFAVADSKGWDEKTHAPGRFDSILVSPGFELNSQATVSVDVASTNKFKALPVVVPDGATWHLCSEAAAVGTQATAAQFRAAYTAGTAYTAGNVSQQQEVVFAAVAVPNESPAEKASEKPSEKPSGVATPTHGASQGGEMLAATGANGTMLLVSGAAVLLFGGLVLLLRRRAHAQYIVVGPPGRIIRKDSLCTCGRW